MKFQVLSWHSRDHDGKFLIHMFGRTEDGKSVHLVTHFKPYFFVKGRVPNKPHVMRKDLWGFQNLKEHVFSMYEFDTLEEFRDEQRKIRNGIYEANIDPMLRFMHRTGIRSTGWAEFDETKCENAYMSSNSDYDFQVSDWKTIHSVNKDDMAPFKIASIDIECYSESGQFPDSMKMSDTCFQIAVTTKQNGEYIDKKIFGVKTEYESEKDMLEAFVKYLKKLDPDVITGWNIFGFDLEYIYNRMVITGCRDYVLGKLDDENADLTVKNLSSSALGNNTLKIVKMIGRYVFDMYQEIKREHKFESYSLNNVSKILLGDKKIDMPVSEIFSRFKNGEGLEEVADYCIKDTELPHAISEKLSLFQNLVEMAKACWVPLNFLSERGQQIKVFSQMAYTARELGFMIPTIRQNRDAPNEGGYQGATVLEAQTGAYYEPITALDFASLYPSIMCAHNLCYSTLVMDKQYLDIPGVTYERFGPHVFALEKDGVRIPSLLPVILERLKVYRKDAKKKMETCPPELYSVYNGKQLAYKISMNSVYGFTGASKGILPLMQIAETVTMRGRQMIEQSKEYVEKNFPGAKVRYGDSVLPETPVMVRRNGGEISIQTIESLSHEWIEYPGFLKDGTDKEQSEIHNIEVWTHEGWKPIKRVIRHKCSKTIWRVVTHTGVVDVTEDHSLLSPSLECLKPKNVEIGTKLFHSFPANVIQDDMIIPNEEELFVIGMFVGDGSCGVYDCPSGRKSSWAINNQNIELLKKCKKILEKMYPDYSFVIMDTIESSSVYKLSPRGDVKKLVNEWRTMCYDGNAKKIPYFAMGHNGFLDGLWASDGCRKDAETIGCHRIDTKNQVTAQWYYMYLRSIGYQVSINTRSDKNNIFRLTFTLSKFRKNPDEIKKIHILHEKWDDYVYDLETEAGTFQAGIGSLIVKNTDSIMVQFDVEGRTGTEAIEYSWKLGERASKEISGLFRSPNKLELEKVYCPYFLYSKKRYAAKMWVEKHGKVVFDKIDVKGLQVVRRDSCKFVRDTCKKLLETVLESSDPSNAVSLAREARDNLLNGTVPSDELVLTKSLAAEYKVNMPHVEVVKKMKERNPGSEPQIGNRVPFVVIKTKKGVDRLFEKAEDPVWAEENKVPLDYEYYFEHQLRKPVEDLLEPLISSDEIFSKPQKKSRKITEFFVKKEEVPSSMTETSSVKKV